MKPLMQPAIQLNCRFFLCKPVANEVGVVAEVFGVVAGDFGSVVALVGAVAALVGSVVALLGAVAALPGMVVEQFCVVAPSSNSVLGSNSVTDQRQATEVIAEVI